MCSGRGAIATRCRSDLQDVAGTGGEAAAAAHAALAAIAFHAGDEGIAAHHAAAALEQADGCDDQVIDQLGSCEMAIP